MSDTTPPTPETPDDSCARPCRCNCGGILKLLLWLALAAAIASLFLSCLIAIPICLGIAFILCIVLFCKGKILAGILGLIGGALSTAIIAILSIFIIPIVLLDQIAQSPETREDFREILSENQAEIRALSEQYPTIKKTLDHFDAKCKEAQQCCPLTPLVPATPTTPAIPATEVVPATPTTPSTPAAEVAPATPATEVVPAIPATATATATSIPAVKLIPATPTKQMTDDDDDGDSNDIDDDKDGADDDARNDDKDDN